ncbi:transglycosylase SLT domain-containing protein [Streptomyces sp. NPDC086787]|uniref:transglycosylase SLT domain-containing protein n=1 Tax=Streptomyces sp. NPDC086787 TaxID=3365759 RepID=UPI0038083174
MPKHASTHRRSYTLTKNHKIAVTGVAMAAATAGLVLSTVPSSAQSFTAEAPATARVAYSTQQIKDVKGSITDQMADKTVKVEAIAAQKKAAAQAAAKQKTVAQGPKKAARERVVPQSASRSVQRPAAKPAGRSYPNNLDGWIRESLDIMKSKGIPGSYSGLHRNILRESSGNPMAINGWDVNAINGVPSKGLLQVIPPTFKAYHVAGTSWNIYDPVANITAACNYAADRYGSMDNVNSAY